MTNDKINTNKLNTWKYY